MKRSLLGSRERSTLRDQDMNYDLILRLLEFRLEFSYRSPIVLPFYFGHEGKKVELEKHAIVGINEISYIRRLREIYLLLSIIVY